jgi:hypothetical protein
MFETSLKKQDFKKSMTANCKAFSKQFPRQVSRQFLRMFPRIFQGSFQGNFQQLQQFLRFTVFQRLFKTLLTVFNSSDDILETRALQASNFKSK